MAWLLNLAYLLVLVLASPWIVWRAVRQGKYRQGWRAKLLGDLPSVDGPPLIWVHAVSVGEVKLAMKLLPELAARFPRHQFVVSATSRTGYSLARRELAEHRVVHAPLDFSWAVRRAMRRLNPVALVLVELELWPNLIEAARRQGAAIFVVNGRLSRRSFRRYLLLRPLVRRMMNAITWIGAQDEVYRQRFEALGSTRCVVTGSIKLDRLETDRENGPAASLRDRSGLESDDLVWIAGSTQPVEDEIVLRVFSQLGERFPQLRLILVPRHPENFASAAAKIRSSGSAWHRWSETTGRIEDRWRILLVDTVGDLSAWWGCADVAFVGGSLCSRGGQNMIEPAAFGAAVSFGPDTRNFQQTATGLVASQGAVVVADEAELAVFVSRCATDPAYRYQLGQAARDWVVGQAGALQRTGEAMQLHLCRDRQVRAA